ncbi:hypothetical protein ACH4PW_18845 [Streptomyces sp. NPDC017082]|uniref:hypothetical protein n=1 Tax=Streptomyces sp. NPDC017082 TaxID=3364974 RepID=UPI0037AB0D0D
MNVLNARTAAVPARPSHPVGIPHRAVTGPAAQGGPMDDPLFDRVAGLALRAAATERGSA